MQTAALRVNDYTFLGRSFLNIYPDQAKEILLYRSFRQNHNYKIDDYFVKFCIIRDLSAPSFRGIAVKNQSKVEERRLFVSCMLHLYNPHVFEFHQRKFYKQRNLTPGFVDQLSQTLLIPYDNLSRQIKEVITHERVYEDYRDTVKGIVEQLKGGEDASR